MRFASRGAAWWAIPILAGAMVLASCTLPAKTSATSTPATPAAAVAPPPQSPPPSVSSPQTEVQLPAAQPVSPEAMATIQAAPEPPAPEPEPEPAAKPAIRKPAQAAAPKSETAAPVAAEAPAVPPPAPPQAEEPRLQPAFPEEQRRRIVGEVERRRGEIEGILRGMNQSRLTAAQKSVIDRIHSFLDVADGAAKRGDLRSADSLSERALILARELASGR